MSPSLQHQYSPLRPLRSEFSTPMAPLSPPQSPLSRHRRPLLKSKSPVALLCPYLVRLVALGPKALQRAAPTMAALQSRMRRSQWLANRKPSKRTTRARLATRFPGILALAGISPGASLPIATPRLDCIAADGALKK